MSQESLTNFVWCCEGKRSNIYSLVANFRYLEFPMLDISMLMMTNSLHWVLEWGTCLRTDSIFYDSFSSSTKLWICWSWNGILHQVDEILDNQACSIPVQNSDKHDWFVMSSACWYCCQKIMIESDKIWWAQTSVFTIMTWLCLVHNLVLMTAKGVQGMIMLETVM